MNTQLLTDFCKTVSVSSERKVNSNTTDGLQTNVFTIPTQRYVVDWQSINVVDFSSQIEIDGLLDDMESGAVSFEWQPPKYFDVTGTAAQNETVFADVVAGNNTFQLTGTFSDGALKLGQMVRFNNHSKVYRVKVDTLAGVNPVVELNSPIKVDLVGGSTQVKTSGVTLKLIADPRSKPTKFERKAGTPAAMFSARFIEDI